MLRLTLKGLAAHKLRVALTALAIVLGVTFVTGTLVLTDTLHNTFTSLFSKIYSHVDFEVRGTAAFSDQQGAGAIRQPISDTLLPTVAAVPGVVASEGLVGGYAQFVGKDGKAVTTGGAPTLGTTFGAKPQLSALHPVSGHGPTNGTEVAMDEGTAKKHGFHVGDRVTVLLPGPPERFTISGIVQFGSADNLGGATLAAFTLPTAQKLFNEEGRVDAIEVATGPGADKATVERAIAKVLPKGVEVVSAQKVADEQSSAINNALGFFSTALLVFALISLFVGGFTILNTFSITVGQRTRELALLRIVGASRGQVFRSVMLEAVVIGLVASLVGIGLGVAMAVGLEALLDAFGISLPKGGLVFAPRTVIVGLGLGLGLGVTVVSAVSPARRAVRIAPIAALQGVQAGTEGNSRRRTVVGTGFALLGAAALTIGLTAPEISLVGLGAFLVFIGVGMLSPLVARPMASVLGRPLARLRGVPGRLGRQNSMRSPRRTAQTAAALMVGLALVSTIAVFGASLSKSATSSVSDAIAADYIVMASSQGGPPTGFSTSATQAVAGLSGVAKASPIYAGQAKIAKSVTFVGGIAPADIGSTVTLRMDQGDGPAALAAGDLLVDTTTATTDKLHVGQRLPVTFAETGPTTLRIGGIFKPNIILGSYLVSRATFARHFALSTLPIVLLVKTSSPATPAMTAELSKGLAGYPNLKVQTRAAYEKEQEAQVNQLLGLVYALLALAIVVALIGIVNTLMLSVFERTREIGLLRAVGMSRRQVRTMIRSEAVILSVFGAVIGIVVGTGLGIALVASLKDQGFTDLVVPWGNMVVFLILAGLLGLIAASWPARRAARLNILEAIATE